MGKLILILMGIGMSFGTLAHDGEDPAPIDEYNLSDLLSLASKGDQDPLTREQLREESDVVVNGVIQSITPGREYFHEEALPDSLPIKTAIFEVAVNYSEKGFEGNTIFFEYIVAGIPIDILNNVKPEIQIELFLKESGLDESKYRIIDSDGRTKGFREHLYYPTRDIALLDQIKSDRKYDIRALVLESGNAPEIDQVDGSLPARGVPDSNIWDDNAEEPYYPEDVREKMLEKR